MIINLRSVSVHILISQWNVTPEHPMPIEHDKGQSRLHATWILRLAALFSQNCTVTWFNRRGDSIHSTVSVEPFQERKRQHTRAKRNELIHECYTLMNRAAYIAGQFLNCCSCGPQLVCEETRIMTDAQPLKCWTPYTRIIYLQRKLIVFQLHLVHIITDKFINRSSVVKSEKKWNLKPIIATTFRLCYHFNCPDEL